MISRKIDFEAIGTLWSIDLIDLPTEFPFEEIVNLIKGKIEEFDKLFSRFRKDSLVLEISQTKGIYNIPRENWEMIYLYKDLYELTKGLVTPLIGTLLEQSGYDRDYSLVAKKLEKPLAWNQAITLDYPRIRIKKPILLDFGALGKGHIIDLISKLFFSYDIHNFCIDAGGDILYKTQKDNFLKIGLEHPDNSKQVIGVVSIKNESICASAGNRRKWGKFHHIMNPQTLKSADEIKATWVIADSAMLADALCTCLFFVEPEQINNRFSFEYLILYPNNSIKKSANFSAELFYG